MRPRAVSVALAVTTFAATAAAEPAAPAEPTKEQCVASFDRGQRAQSDRALRRAQTDLIVCAQESCPTVLRADCAGVLAEVQAALPSVVFAADDGSGHELTDVKVYAGTELLVPSLDGRAVPIDPGTFELRFERAGQTPVVVSRMIREGEKSRVIRVSLGAPAGPDRGPDVSLGRRTPVGWIVPGALAAVGLAAAGVALYTRLSFDSRVDDLRHGCAPECSQGDRDDLSGMVVTSNVALGVGVGALALSVATWFLLAPPTSQSRARSSPGVFTW